MPPSANIMTTVGHSLAGLSIGVLCLPRGRAWPVPAAVLAACVLLANVPDYGFFWGQGTYDIRHSVFVNTGLMLPALLLFGLWRRGRQSIGGWPVVIGGIAAWWSHLLLDSTYNHGQGVAILWPINDATSLCLPIPWFQTLQQGSKFTAANLRTFAVELVCYGGLLAFCVLIRRWRRQPGRPPRSALNHSCKKSPRGPDQARLRLRSGN